MLAKQPAKHCIISSRQRANHIIDTGMLGGALDAFPIPYHPSPIAVGDVVHRGRLVAHVFLQDEGYILMQVIHRDGSEIYPVKRDTTLIGVVEARDQLHQSGFPRSVFSYQSYDLPRVDM